MTTYVLMSLGDEDCDGDDYVVAVSDSVSKLKEHAEKTFAYSGKYKWGEFENGMVYCEYDVPSVYLHRQNAFHITEVDFI